MKFTRIIAIAIISATAIIALNQNLLSWGIFNLFTDVEYSEEGLQKAENFDPDRDILYLPKIEERDIFETMRDLSIIRKKEVRKYLYIYLTSGREYVKRGITRSYLHKDTIDRIFDENPDLPRELTLLPLLESGFNPFAVSRSRATGLWQFVGNTSSPLGLKVNSWVDERRSVEKSTRAAVRHLRTLHRIFKRWDLALAAYNGGSGHVGRAMEKSGARTIWELNRAKVLRNETDEYVSRFIALALIYNHQRLFGLNDEIEKEYGSDIETVRVPFSVHLKYISEMTEIPREDIRKMNPELQDDIIPPSTDGYPLKITARAADILHNDGIARIEPHRIPSFRNYRIKSGDTIASIAKLFKKKTN